MLSPIRIEINFQELLLSVLSGRLKPLLVSFGFLGVVGLQALIYLSSDCFATGVVTFG